MKWATNVTRKNLRSFGVCIGKFTKSKKFHIHVTALDVIGPYAKVRKCLFEYLYTLYVAPVLCM